MKTKKLIPFVIVVVLLIAIGVALSVNGSKNASTAFLTKYGLNGQDVKEIVGQLDSRIDEPLDLSSSINGKMLTLTDGKQTVSLDLPKDEFYLSFAPYLTHTHPCQFHSLSSCRGELVNVPVVTKIVASDGEVLVDQTLMSMANGFIGVWLPKGLEATVTVTYDGKTATAPISTHADSATCLTTPLQLN